MDISLKVTQQIIISWSKLFAYKSFLRAIRSTVFLRKLLISTQYTTTAPVTAIIEDIPEMYSYFGPSNLPHNCANSLIGLIGVSENTNGWDFKKQNH